jgi:hypothetical protein
MYENKVNRKLFGTNGEKATQVIGKLDTVEQHNLYFSADVNRATTITWEERITLIGETKNTDTILAGYLKG